jgi:hypothetical protein
MLTRLVACSFLSGRQYYAIAALKQEKEAKWDDGKEEEEEETTEFSIQSIVATCDGVCGEGVGCELLVRECGCEL